MGLLVQIIEQKDHMHTRQDLSYSLLFQLQNGR